MKSIDAKFEIMTPISKGGIDELKAIEETARICYRSEDLITDDGLSAKDMVRKLIKRGHEAMLEHSILKVRFHVDRGVSHELVRHRLASFAQESTRYVNYSKDKFGNEITVIDLSHGMQLDPVCALMDTSPDCNAQAIYNEWAEAMRDSERHYMKMLEYGASPQIARSVLPNSTKTTIDISANYREWRNIFKLRADTPAHPQMREVMVPLLRTLKGLIPVVFDDIDEYQAGVKDELREKYISVHDRYFEYQADSKLCGKSNN